MMEPVEILLFNRKCYNGGLETVEAEVIIARFYSKIINNIKLVEIEGEEIITGPND